MVIRIASRKSDLARIQAYAVGKVLEQFQPSLKVQHHFRESLGDINLHDPLWKMPTQGVFTEDFYRDLADDKADMVVHSWKDLPVIERPDTEVYATLPRADLRDILLVKKKSISAIRSSGQIKIFSSSPRREYNLRPLLQEILPFKLESVSFTSVRGNVPTRLQKLFSEEADGLVLAKAALDRILEAPGGEFVPVKEQIRKLLGETFWMVLPLSQNPAAAAQGALAIEICRSRDDLRELLDRVCCASTWRSAQEERKILSGYGGGCHQKIGVSVLKRSFGQIIYLKGLTDRGETLDRCQLVRAKAMTWPKTTIDKIFPAKPGGDLFFERENVTVDKSLLANRDLWVARADALPDEYAPLPSQRIWCSGVSTWKKLALRGIWVNGCADSLGEREEPSVDTLVGAKINWLKLTHEAGVGTKNGLDTLGTYRLRPKNSLPDLMDKSYFYWTSFSQFRLATERWPEIEKGFHACGPGHTYDLISSRIGERGGGEGKVEVFLSHTDWLKEVLL